MNDTLKKFHYPDSLIFESDHWAVLLRPAQVTLGALVLGTKSDAQSFAEISPEAARALPDVTGRIETVLRDLFGYDKINYLALMMVDKEFHFHVIPRYGRTVRFAGKEFRDPGWPRFPDLSQVTETSTSCRRLVGGSGSPRAVSGSRPRRIARCRRRSARTA